LARGLAHKARLKRPREAAVSEGAPEDRNCKTGREEQDRKR
jgi:hypothetical protein